MLFFLYGLDTYRSLEKLNEIVDHYKKVHKSGLNLKYFEGERLNFQDFKDEFQSVSMLKEKKLFILKNIAKNEPFKDKFLKTINDFVNSENIILFYEEEIKEDEFFETLKENGKWQNSEPLNNLNLKLWLKREFKKYQTEVDERALHQLIEYVGNNLWQMANEVLKLASYKNQKKIESKDIELLVSPKIEVSIFKTIDALAEKEKKIALNLIHQHLEKGDDPLYLLSMINYQFRNLLMIKSEFSSNTGMFPINNLSKRLGMPPFVVRKSFGQASKFTFEELTKIYQKIFQVDLAIKTGKIEPETALDLLIGEI